MYYTFSTKPCIIPGWAEMFIGLLWCNGRIWPNVVYFFRHSLPCGPHTSSTGVAALGFPWYGSSHPDPQKSPQLQIWPHHLSDTASQPSVWFSCWGTWNSQMVPNQENVEGDQPVKFKATVMHSSHCNHRLVHRSIVLVKQDSLRHAILQAVHEMSLVLLYKVLNYLSSVGLSGRKHYSWYHERLKLMLAKFYCCGTTPSKSSYMCFSANSITWHWHRRIPL